MTNQPNTPAQPMPRLPLPPPDVQVLLREGGTQRGRLGREMEGGEGKGRKRGEWVKGKEDKGRIDNACVKVQN